MQGVTKKEKNKMSRRVSQSFTLSYTELKYILSIFSETLRFISEPLRENKNNFFFNLMEFVVIRFYKHIIPKGILNLFFIRFF